MNVSAGRASGTKEPHQISPPHMSGSKAFGSWALAHVRKIIQEQALDVSNVVVRKFAQVRLSVKWYSAPFLRPKSHFHLLLQLA
jgi:hypothetical protein